MEIAAVPLLAIAAVFTALVLTAWVMATVIMLRPIIVFIARLLAEIPAVGDALANAVLNLENGIYRWIQGLVNEAYNAGVGALVDTMNTYANAHSGDAYSQRLVSATLAAAVITASDAAHNRVNPPTQTYVTDGTTVNNTYVTNYIDNTTTVSEGYTQSAYGELAGWASTAIQVAYDNIGALNGRVDEANQYTQASVAGAETYAATLADTAKADAVAAAADYTNAQVATAEDYTTQVRDYATATATHTQEWTEGYVGEHEDTLKREVEAGLAATALIATTVAGEFADFMKNCGGPMCTDGLPFIKMLSGLKGLLETGLLVGFLVEAYTDPEGTADVTVAVADTVTGPAKALFSAMFGG